MVAMVALVVAALKLALPEVLALQVKVTMAVRVVTVVLAVALALLVKMPTARLSEQMAVTVCSGLQIAPTTLEAVAVALVQNRLKLM
jgi:hypothetical protein